MDYIVVTLSDERDMVISLDHIAAFTDEGTCTRIELSNTSHVYAQGNITKQLREYLRKSNYQIVKIGE